MKEKITGSGPHGFIKWKSCINNLIVFYTVISLVVQVRAVYAVYLDFSKVFDTHLPIMPS